MPLHLCTCDGGAHCCIAFLALVMVEHIVIHSLVFFCGDKSFFVRLFGQPTWCLLSMIMSLPPAIGPTLGTNFLVVVGFKLSPLEGVASRALGLWQRTETKAIDVDK